MRRHFTHSFNFSRTGFRLAGMYNSKNKMNREKNWKSLQISGEKYIIDNFERVQSPH